MSSHAEILGFEVATLAAKIRAKELSPIEITEAYLERIEALDEKILAYITVTADDARVAARKAEDEIMLGNWRGPFHGVPIALKDLCNTRAVLTTGGSKILGTFVPDFDCTVWARLREAGAILLGKVDAEIPAPASGILQDIKVVEGNTVQVNTVVGTIAGDGEAASSRPAARATVPEPAPSSPQKKEATPAVPPPAEAKTETREDADDHARSSPSGSQNRP